MEITRKYLFYISSAGLIAGMVLLDIARIVPSISMVLIALLGISYLIWPSLKAEVPDKLPFLALAATFILLLPSWFYSDNHGYLYSKWQVALPYLILPLAFMVIPRQSIKGYFVLYEFYFILILLIAISAFVYYLANMDMVHQLYLESKVMPTFVKHHPTMSLMVVLGIYTGYRIYTSGFYYKFPWERKVILIGSIFLFIFSHVFSVRSGLLALYLLLFTELSMQLRCHKKRKTVFLTGIVVVLCGSVILLLSPTVSNKIENTSKDLEQYQSKGSANNQSLGSRMISYKNSVEIAQNTSMLFGCGLGDIEDLNLEIFKSKYPDISKPIIPHNQFLFYFASIGLTGVVAFTVLFFFPLFYHKGYQNSLLLAQYVILLTGFQVEAPIETQLGVAFSLTFILLPLHAGKSVFKA